MDSMIDSLITSARTRSRFISSLVMPPILPRMKKPATRAGTEDSELIYLRNRITTASSAVISVAKSNIERTQNIAVPLSHAVLGLVGNGTEEKNSRAALVMAMQAKIKLILPLAQLTASRSNRQIYRPQKKKPACPCGLPSTIWSARCRGWGFGEMGLDNSCIETIGE